MRKKKSNKTVQLSVEIQLHCILLQQNGATLIPEVRITSPCPARRVERALH